MKEGQTHETKFLEVGSESADIDVGIYNLVREIWLSGIETSNSCEDGDFGSRPERRRMATD